MNLKRNRNELEKMFLSFLQVCRPACCPPDEVAWNPPVRLRQSRRKPHETTVKGN